jgi:hypothetical protein
VHKAKDEAVSEAALMSQSDDTSATTLDNELLRLYGFTDFGIDKFFFSAGNDYYALLRPTPATTFVFGNLNLYLDAHPLPHVRTLIELRFTLSPNGEETQLGPPVGTSYQRTDTTTFDFAAPSSQAQLRLAGLFIERAYSQYDFAQWLKIKWGLYLNPFGIWNVDHGSPTLIALMLPTAIAGQMFPTRLLGVEANGSQFFGSTELGYSLHISNGRSPLDFAVTENKAIGARLFLAQEGDFGRLVLGASGYVGTYVDKTKKFDIRPNNVWDWSSVVDYEEQVLGFDVALDAGGFRLRSEAMLRWVKYHDGKSEQIYAQDGSVQFLPNRLEWDVYLIAAYRTPWALEPFVEVELDSKAFKLPAWSGNARTSSSNVAVAAPSVGLNLEITSNLLIKTQVTYITAYEYDFTHRSTNVPVIFIRAVDSF